MIERISIVSAHQKSSIFLPVPSPSPTALKAFVAAAFVLLVSLGAAPAHQRAITKTFVNDWPVPIRLEVKAGDKHPCAENSTVKEVELKPKASVTVDMDPGDCVCYRRTANPGKGNDLQLVWTESCTNVAETIRL